jgi:hypothetical protein
MRMPSGRRRESRLSFRGRTDAGALDVESKRTCKEPPTVKNAILMFHCLMRAMPLNHEMSVSNICYAAQNDGGPVIEEWDLSVRRALLNDENVYFEHPVGDQWQRVRVYKPIRFGGARA